MLNVQKSNKKQVSCLFFSSKSKDKLNKKAELFQEKLINNYLPDFPMKRCSSDKPYVNDLIKSLIRKKLKTVSPRKN